MSNANPPSRNEYRHGNAAVSGRHPASTEKWRREHDAVAELLAEVTTPGARVLDIPVGAGRFFELYKELGLRVLGQDTSADMLREARARAAALSFHQVSLDHGDVTDIQLRTDAVDVAVCIRLMNLVPFEVFERALAELSEVAANHVIVGIRTHDNRAVLRRQAANVRRRVLHRQSKLTIHDIAKVKRAFSRAGVRVIDRRRIVTGANGTSEYDIFLLDVRDDRGRDSR